MKAEGGGQALSAARREGKEKERGVPPFPLRFPPEGKKLREF